MTIDDLDTVLSKIDELQNLFGFWGTVFIIALIICVGFLIWYIKRSIDMLPQKALKKFQSALDQDLFKFKSQHTKQVDAVHDIYQKFQKMTSMLDYIKNGENFTQPMEPSEEISTLINFRHEFKREFQKNRPLFRVELCGKIDNVINTVDEFIKTYHEGILPPLSEEDQKRNAEMNQGLYLAGIWSEKELGEVLDELDNIRIDIEAEFRKIYGTSN